MAAALLVLAVGAGLVGFPGLAHVGPPASGRVASPSAAALAATATVLPSPTWTPGPTPTHNPVPSPTMGPLPGIAMELLPGLVALAKVGTYSYWGALSDRIVLVAVWSGASRIPTAFDLFSGQRWTLRAPGPGDLAPDGSLGDIVVSDFVPAAGTQHAGLHGLVLENVATGSERTVWPTGGYDRFWLEGYTEGFAYGQMQQSNSSPGAYPYRAARAIVVNLATGVISDLTPSTASTPPNADVVGIDRGRALVASWGPIGPIGQTWPLQALRLVSLATGEAGPPLPIDTSALPGSVTTLGFLDGQVVGQTLAGSDPATEIVRVFVYDVATGSLGLVPVRDPADSIQCPYRVDGTHLACEERGSGSDHVLLVYDTVSQIASTMPTTGLQSPNLLEAGNGCVAIGDYAGGPPRVYQLDSGLVYELELGGRTAPTNMNVVEGSLLVSSDLDGPAWRLP